MDPVTHAVIGMSISKIAGHGVTPADPVSAGIIIGAVFPDIDIVFQKWGDYAYLKNHRVITHSVFGLVISSMLIAMVLGGLYHTRNISGIFLGTLIGGLSHTLFDMLNSFGAKLLWPIINRKLSFSLLTVVDPLLFVLLLGYVISSGGLQDTILNMLMLYMVSRVVMRVSIKHELRKRFRGTFEKINLIPSMVGAFKWNFIVEAGSFNVVGEKNILKRGITHVKTLYKFQEDKLDRVILSPIGRFFREFTPLFHIAREKLEGITRYIFIDMRYYYKDDFMHHGVLELDENDNIIKSSFNPYSMDKSYNV